MDQQEQKVESLDSRVGGWESLVKSLTDRIDTLEKKIDARLDRMSADFVRERKSSLAWLRGGTVTLVIVLLGLAAQWGVLKFRVSELDISAQAASTNSVTRSELVTAMASASAMNDYRHSVLLDKLAEVKAAANSK